MSFHIRPFELGDRELLLNIGAETAFFGAPIECYLEDRRVFMDVFYAYYTDYEPELAWIACDEERVVGFITGCLDSASYGRVFRRKIVPKVMKNAARGAYQIGPKTWRYLLHAAMAAFRHEIPGADTVLYPSHLHINLLPAWRGFGLGRRLISALLNQLREAKSPGVHLHTTNMNQTACLLYEKMGFQLLAARPTRMYAYLVDRPVENLCYGLKLTACDISPVQA